MNDFTLFDEFFSIKYLSFNADFNSNGSFIKGKLENQVHFIDKINRIKCS